MPPTTLSPFQPSPKRKRDQQPPPPLATSSLRAATTPDPPRGCTPDSPRNAVADQLRGMSLAVIPMSPLSPMEDIVRKKPKLDAPREDSGTSLDEHLAAAKSKAQQQQPQKKKKKVVMHECIAVHYSPSTDDVGEREIPETPQLQPRTHPDTASFAQHPASVSSIIPNTESTSQSSTATQYSPTKENGGASQRAKSPSPPLSSLTWADSEITGHLAGPSTDPDDDGTGLNGIGFQPTPAMAYVRAQKRRQQVLDWKAREAREARAKRSERRRRGIGGASSREATVEREIRAAVPEVSEAGRSVKFAV